MLLVCVSSLLLRGHATNKLGVVFGGVDFAPTQICFGPFLFPLYLSLFFFFFFWPLRNDQHTHLGEASVNGPV